MKTITGTLIFLCIFIGLHAQDTLPIINDFQLYNGTNLTTAYPGWSEGTGEEAPAGGSSSWFSSEELFDKAVAVNFTNTTTHRDWLITPSFAATEQTKITFSAALTLLYDDPAQGYFGHDDSVSIMVKPNGGTYEPVFTFDINNNLTNQMKIQEVSLGNFAGDTIQLAFFATDGNQPTGFSSFHFDDVIIKNAVPIDIQILRIVSPGIHTCLTENTPVIVEVRNDGYEQIAGIPFRIRSRGALNENIYAFANDTLMPGELKTINPGALNITDTGTYNLSIGTEIANDGDATNNITDTITLKHKLPRKLPLPIMTFTDFYQDNLNEIYPDWNEARGEGAPMVYKNTDWQGDDHYFSRGASVYFTAVGTRDWLVGPIIEATEHTHISFDAAIYYEDFSSAMGSDDKLAVMVSTDCGTTWEEAGAIDNNAGLDSVYQHFDFSLSEYAGEHLKIAVYATSGNTNDYQDYIFFVDNLTARNIWNTDIGITDVITPQASCEFTDSEPLTIEVTNTGKNPIDEFTATYTLNQGPPIIETAVETILPGDSYEYEFTQTMNLTIASNNVIEIYLTLAGDENQENDSLVFEPVLSAFDLATQGTYFAGFESSEDLSGWSVVNGNSDDETWEVNTDAQYAYEGSNSYSYFSNNTTVTSDDWLFSPCFYLEAGKTYKTSFWYKNRASAFPEKLRLNLATAADPSETVQVINDLGAIDNSDYLQTIDEFSVAQSGTYYFAWEAYGDADQFGMHIDNVEIWQEFDTDLTIDDVVIPRNTDGTNCTLLNTELIHVTVKNIGANSVSSFDLNATLNETNPVNQTFSRTIAPGDTAIVELNQEILIEPGINYNINLWVQTSGDENAANDSALLQNFNLDNYNTSFEANDDNSNWSNQSIAGVNEWEILNDPDNARSGEQYYAIRTDGAGGNSSNDDWLFSGCHYLEAGKCYELKFWYRSRFSTENLTVMLGNNPDHTSMSTQLFDDPDFSSNNYLSANVLVSVETSGAYYFGFHTDGETTGRYYVILDDISLKESEASPMVEVTPHLLDREIYFETQAENINSFLWDFGDGSYSTLQSPTHIYPENDTYNITLTATSACGDIIWDSAITQNFDEISADFEYTVDGLMVSFEAMVSNVDHITWSMDDGYQAIGNNVVHIYNNQSTYDVTMYAYSPYEQVQVTKAVETGVGISQIKNETISVYPNPAKKQIGINSKSTITHIEIVDITGKQMYKQEHSQKQVFIDLSEFASGAYILLIRTHKDLEQVKIIVE